MYIDKELFFLNKRLKGDKLQYPSANSCRHCYLVDFTSRFSGSAMLLKSSANITNISIHVSHLWKPLRVVCQKPIFQQGLSWRHKYHIGLSAGSLGKHWS